MQNEDDDYWYNINFWLLIFLAINLATFSSYAVERVAFGILGENLILRVRKLLFGEILYKEIPWFDRREAAPGVLTNILSEDISNLTGMTTETIAVYMESFMGLALGLFLSFFFSWRMALITVGMAPFLFASGLLKALLMKKQS